MTCWVARRDYPDDLERQFMMPYRVVIGDDNLAFIDSARRLLTCDPNVVIVGHAQSGAAVLEQIALLRPDMLLLSVNLPGSGGLEFVRHIKANTDSPYVIVLALDDLEDYRTAALAVGADGFIAKAEFAAQAIPLTQALFNLVATGEVGDAHGVPRQLPNPGAGQ
jgi:DNA-binding NarL/FixJ family response regulator